MNFLCWLIDHEWARPKDLWLRCKRCNVEPYDDVTLPEWWLNLYHFTLAPKIKRVAIWIRSRPCWFKDHDWSPTSWFCSRCKQSGIEVAEQGEWTWPLWKKLWRSWLSDRLYVVKPDLDGQNIYAVEALGTRFGIERSTIYIRGEKYMTRYMLYLGPIGLRLHQLFRGDDDRSSHTHPWKWFITLPFTTYLERVYHRGVFQKFQVVRAQRFHFRGRDFEHIVIGKHHGFPAPFWTFVITGPKNDEWGFYPEPDKFVPWREYKA